MKFNWFHGLMLVLIAFISMMTYFVVKSSHQNLDLVSEKYYEEEINYQNKINHISNSKALITDVSFEVKDGILLLHFPVEFINKSIRGNLKMYYAPNKNGDQTIAVNSNNGEFQIDVNKFKGKYSLQLDWTCDNQNYFSEKKITL
jgi:hypothetical protein